MKKKLKPAISLLIITFVLLSLVPLSSATASGINVQADSIEEKLNALRIEFIVCPSSKRFCYEEYMYLSSGSHFSENH